jgi:uncharacterized protein YjeT (DUF2065 family)
MVGTRHLVSVLFAIDKHHLAGIAVIVVGALVAGFGGFRALKRVSGAALISLAGVAAVVVGVLVYTHTIHS